MSDGQHQPEGRMSHSDAFTRQMERNPLLRSTVVMVALLDAAPDADALAVSVRRASRRIPLMRATLAPTRTGKGRPRWIPGGDVDQRWHVQRTSVAAPGTWAQAMEVAARAAVTAFDPARPLWDITVVEGLPEGRCVVVMKFHHSITDGIGGVALAAYLFDLDGIPTDPALPELAAFPVPASRPPLHRRVAARAAALREHPRESLVGTARTARSVARVVAPMRRTFSPVMVERGLARHFDVLDLPLEALRKAARSADGKLNDAFLAGITGGLREYHARLGAPVDRLRVSLPISLRLPDDPLGGNLITLVRFPVEVAQPDPAERIRTTSQDTERWRAEPALPWTQRIAAGLNLLPPAAVGSMLTHVDFLASNVPGFPLRASLGGAGLLALYPFGPTAGASMNLTLMSYEGICCVGVSCDADAVTDPDLLMECLEQGFSEVLALAGEHPPVRRRGRRDPSA